MAQVQSQRTRGDQGNFNRHKCLAMTICTFTIIGGIVGGLNHAVSIGFKYDRPVGNETGLNKVDDDLYKEEGMTVIMILAGGLLGCAGGVALGVVVDLVNNCCCCFEQRAQVYALDP